MPKKWQGENSKSAEAKARKEAKKVEENERKERQKEDEFWQDDDKNVQKKMQRKDEKERKKHEVQERKQTAKALLEKEMEQIGGKGPPVGSQKMTQAEIAAQQERQLMERQKAEEKARMDAKKIVDDTSGKIEENVNRLEVEGELAQTVDEALVILGTPGVDAADRHPEKRVKAAYASFEERRMPSLKAENPNLRLSQLRQMLKKEWQRSPENPMNQPQPET